MKDELPGTGRFAYRSDAPSLKLAPASWGVKEYRKIATVHAMQMDRPFIVETLEGVMKGEAGDYLCEGPAGERWPIKKAIFESTYRAVATTAFPMEEADSDFERGFRAGLRERNV